MKQAISLLEINLEEHRRQQRIALNDLAKATAMFDNCKTKNATLISYIAGLEEALTMLRAQQALKEHSGNGESTP